MLDSLVGSKEWSLESTPRIFPIRIFYSHKFEGLDLSLRDNFVYFDFFIIRNYILTFFKPFQT